MTTRSTSYQHDVWCIPQPMKAANYTPLFEAHEPYAVETDLARMGGFGIASASRDELLYADMQTQAWGGAGPRLGAGRSGFYRGCYVKGVGRTSLAGNWALASDWYHGTGHMFPMAAVREYLASVFMEAKGLGHHIVPCEGLLLRRMDESLREDIETAMGDEIRLLTPIDRALQAISIKPAGFARMSNVLWLLTRMYGRGEEWAHVSVTIERYARNAAVDPDQCSPDSIADALASATKRAIDSFFDHFAAGVSWQSIWNNMTLDGRFLDLEVPYFACRPYFGAAQAFDLVAGPSATDRPAMLAGIEPLEAAFEAKVGLTRLADRIGSLARTPVRWKPLERDFMLGLEEAIAEVANGPMFERDNLVPRVAAQLDGLPGAPANVEALIDRFFEDRNNAYFWPKLETPLEMTDIVFHRTEPTVSQVLWLPPGAFERDDWEDAMFMNGVFRSIEEAEDVDEALARIHAARDAIQARFVTGSRR